MNFAETLEILLKISKIKMKDLSDYLGYDTSYISKWVNNKNIPTYKNIFLALEQMGEFIGKGVYDNRQEEELKKFTKRNIELITLKDVQNVVKSALRDGYFVSEASQEFEIPDFEDEIKTFTDEKESIENIMLEIHRAVALSEGTVNIYLVANYLDIMRQVMDNEEYLVVTKDCEINFHWIAEEGSTVFTDDGDKVMLNLLSMSKYLNINLYKTAQAHPRPYLFIENNIVINYIAGHDDRMLMVNFSKEDFILEEYQTITSQLLHNSKSIFNSGSKLQLESNVFTQVEKKGERIVVYSSFMEFACVPEIYLEDIFKRNNIPLDKWDTIKKIHNALKELNSNNTVYTILNKHSLLRDIPKRRVIFGNYEAFLLDHEWEALIETFLEKLKEARSYHLGIMHSSTHNYRLSLSRIKLVVAEDFTGIKKEPGFTDGFTEDYYFVVDESFNKMVNNMIDHILENDNIQWLNYENFENLVRGIEKAFT